MGESLIKLKSVEKNNRSVTLWEITEYQDAYYLIKSEGFLSSPIEDLGIANSVFETKIKEVFNGEES